MRYFLQNPQKNLPSHPLPNLSAIQHDSFNWLIETGIKEILEEVSPIQDYTGRGWELSFASPRFEPPGVSVEEALEKGLTYQSAWYLKARLTDVNSGKFLEEEVYMGEMPMISPAGTFIMNGVERVVVNQLTRSEGVFFVPVEDPLSSATLSGAKVLPKNGAWLEFETSRSGYFSVKIDKKRKLAATTLLRIFGLETDQKIREAFAGLSEKSNGAADFIEKTLEKDQTKSYNEAVLEVFKRLRPGDPLILENAKQVVENLFFNRRRYSLGKSGRFKLNQKLRGLEKAKENASPVLGKEDLILIFEKLIALNLGEGEFDDIDHLSNRRIRSVGELVANQIRFGFLQLERVAKERMSLQPRGQLCSPASLVSSRPITARVHSFFASGQLSQFQEQVNPLSGLDHQRRLSVVGPGGLTRERASFSVRDAHYSHYGRICAVRTPEGPNIGLITYLALYAQVNEYGFLETPYRKLEKVSVDGKETVRPTEEIVYLAPYDEDSVFIADASTPLDEKGFFTKSLVPLRNRGEFFVGPAATASYMDLLPRQIVGASASLIPFLQNDDVNRSLMGANQQTQAVPLLRPESPFVGTGLESEVAYNSGVLLIASSDGIVSRADAALVAIKSNDNKKEDVYKLKKFWMSNQETCYNQKVLVNTGQKVKKGDVLADGPATEGGELAIGANLRIAYMFWEGYGYEDGIVISERLVKEDILSSIQITRHSVQVLETKLGPEEITRDIPNVSEESLRNLDENGLVIIGANVKPGDVLVGKIAPKGETELSAEERLLRAIFGEKARDVRDNSLKAPHGESGTVINVKVLERGENSELPAGVIKEIQVFVAKIRKITVGDKLAGRHGNKGVISKILPIEDMPHLPNGEAVDIIISPASVVSRMNVGQLLEARLGMAAENLGKKYAVEQFVKYDPEIFEKELKEAGASLYGKTELIDGRTGEPFDQEVVLGNAYILKLMHMVEDKMHARSTGPYGLITQQPLGGKAQFGGQRFGEMEVWALEAYGAAHALQEMLTIKSDDLVGRTKAYQAIIQGEPIPEATIPESFKLLIRELNGLGLKVETLANEETKRSLDKISEKNEES
ncbi:MAG: DNA-directed RNA polymerase subunit beta [Patescibacteria group bacterium]|nr:DNA-directed RNA polymerase subunit beta [Patescibacteria group bacterium]